MYFRFLSRAYRHLVNAAGKSPFTPMTKWQPQTYVTMGLLGGGTVLAGSLLTMTAANDEAKLTVLDLSARAPDTDHLSDGHFSHAISCCRRLVQFKREELALPGVVVAVTVDGKLVWQEGFGYSDVENLTPCRSDQTMRIASISKCIAMAVAARLMDQGKLDIDKPIQHYLPKFPTKFVNGEKVSITTRQLMSHLGGIRHYEKNSTKASICDGEMKEFYLRDEYSSVTEALSIFVNDNLEHAPGSQYLYTTHGWTLISAVLEAASGQQFGKMTEDLFRELGMGRSCLGYHKPLIADQARYYKRNDKARLENAPYVDLSCKWAGGGMVSNVQDLCQFGNAMLHSYQCENGYIRSRTMGEMWTVADKSRGMVRWVENGGYGLGWGVDEGNQDSRKGSLKPFRAIHTGGAVGASSVLTIIPINDSTTSAPSGIVVAVITNLQAVSLSKLSLEIGMKFMHETEN